VSSVALVLSVLLHVLFFATVSFHFRIEPAEPAAPLRTFQIDDAMQDYNIEIADVGFGEPDPEPLPVRRLLPAPAPLPPAVRAPLTAGEVAPGAAAGEPGAAGAARGGSVTERLSRGRRDPQLLAPVDRLPPEEVSEAEWLRLRLANRLEMHNDSIAAEAEAKLRATDWTVKGKDGSRWGVSPGKIHLGNVTLPLPFGFAGSAQTQAEMAERTRTWNESQAQGARVEAAETFEQRVKAIRERQQVARDSVRRAGGG